MDVAEGSGGESDSVSETAAVAFVDLAGFTALTEVYGDQSAIRVLGLFEDIVRDALGNELAPIKWIGDEAMLSFPDVETALQALGRLLSTCRSEPRLPLTRTGLNHGPVVRRAGDLFGSTVNIAARITALASPGQLVAGGRVAEVAATLGITVRDLGRVVVRSVAEPISLYALELAEASDAAWIDPVCKMHAPYAAFHRPASGEPWFCSDRCAEAYRRSPQTYPFP